MQVESGAVISFALPFPPSVNGLFPGDGKRRWASKPYKAWRIEASAYVPNETIKGHYALMIRFDRPDRRARDCANYEKAVSDLLVSKGVVEDDSLCDRLILDWTGREPIKPAKAHVSLVAVTGPLAPINFQSQRAA